MSIIRFSEYITAIDEVASLVESCEKENLGLLEFFDVINHSPYLTLEEVTTTGGIEQLVVPMAIKLARKLPSNFTEIAKDILKEEFNDEEFLKWIEKQAPIYQKTYGDRAQEILYAVALTKYNKLAGTKLDPKKKFKGIGHGGKLLWER